MADESTWLDAEELRPIYKDGSELKYTDNNPARKMISLEDGFAITRNNWGFLNLDYWARLCGCTVEELIAGASGTLIFKDPKQVDLGADDTAGWVTAEEILKGNRIHKLRRAKELEKTHEEMRPVVDLLLANLPEEVSGADIHVNIGSTWVLSIADFIPNFIGHLMHMKTPPDVKYNSYTGKWSIYCCTKPNDVLNHITYGTVKMSAIQILEHKLNARPIKVYEQVTSFAKGSCDSVLDQAGTLAAREKSKAIDAAFQDYCHGDRENEEILQKAYVDLYGYGISRYDGSYLKLEDMSPDVTLYRHQKDAVAHILAGNNCLLAHHVGSGKTYEYSCGVHELIRLGISKKALIVVPKSTLEASARIYTKLYPKDNVLVVRPRREFSAMNREDTLDEIRQEESMVVFMTYSSFDMITLSKKYAFDVKDALLRECLRQVQNAPNRRERSMAEAHERRTRKAVEKYKENFADTKTACFDLLGFDILVCDEAHNYKNITLGYSCENIVGVHARGSKKADNMLEKVRCIQKNNGHVIFSTGTPITNSLADLYVLQQYLQPSELKLCNIDHFNDWINSFCEEEYSFEVDVDSKNCRFTTRFSRFHNLPELMCMFSEVCDFYQGDDEEFGLPSFSGYRDIVVKKSEEQKQYIDELASRTDAIRGHKVKRKQDNLLKITVDGREAALDIRLVNPEADPESNESKTHVCAANMARLYEEYPGTCQIAFSDISTPKAGFNLYDELKKELISMGVNEAEIAFVHDAVNETQRGKLEELFNKGRIRILIGSTAKLGTGSNVQERLLAIHHLDVPWRPADMVQREGRILRQGNTCEEVFIYRYITESSFDAYTYQILENKQKFISQFLSGTLSAVHRTESDCADTVLSFSEIKALAIGNPLIKERVEVSNKLERARINQRQKKKELISMEEIEMRLPGLISRRRALLAGAKRDRRHYEKCRTSVKKYERQMFGEELLYALNHNVEWERERVFDTYQGFDVILPKGMVRDKPYVLLKGSGGNRYRVAMDKDKAMGVCQRLDYTLEHLDSAIERHKNKLTELTVQEKQVKHDLAIGNVYDAEVEALVSRLDEIDKILKEDTVA